MMGHGYYGTWLNDREHHEERFAWWPVRSSFGKKCIWLTKYHIVHVLYDENGRPPIKGPHWKRIYAPEEYTYYCLVSQKALF